MRVGNADNALGGKGFNLTGLDYPSNSGNVVKIDRLYYRFPLGSDFTVVAGPRMRNTENFGYKPSAYTAGGHPQLISFLVASVSREYGVRLLVLVSVLSIPHLMKRVMHISHWLQTMLLRMGT